MSMRCHSFRGELARALEQQEPLADLAFHGHLVSCPHCRRLLEEEQALDLVLAEWPRPRMPRAIVSRLLLRLERERAAELEHERAAGLARESERADESADEPAKEPATEPATGPATGPANVSVNVSANVSAGARVPEPLDRLLERAGAIDAPADLSARLLAELAPARREAALDALLERVPTPVVPGDLAARLLNGLARERRLAAPSSAADRAGFESGTPRRTDHAARRAGSVEPSLERSESAARAAQRTTRVRAARTRVWLSLAAAAVLVLGASLWSLLRTRVQTPPRELLAELELLESIDLLQGSDVDVLLSDLPDDEIDLLQWSSDAANGAQPIPAKSGGGGNG